MPESASPPLDALKASPPSPSAGRPTSPLAGDVGRRLIPKRQAPPPPSPPTESRLVLAVSTFAPGGPPPPPATPSPSAGPRTPPRSTSRVAARNLMIRLIDEEEEEEYSDVESSLLLPPRGPQPPLVAPSRGSPSSGGGNPSARRPKVSAWPISAEMRPRGDSLPPLPPQGGFRPSRSPLDPLEEQPSGGPTWDARLDSRSPASDSDRKRNCDRCLGDLSEEGEGEEEGDSWRRRVEAGACLQRTDSMATVAHIYEDLLVAPRLRIRVTLTNLTVVVVMAAFLLPNTAALLFALFRLVFGTLFPAYYSYKAVKTKDVKEYVKWMMYWIVFAFFTCMETITDIFLSFWFPFYYELKILVVLWLLSPATRGSSIMYRKFVHPWLTNREGDIDECIAKAKQQGYSAVVHLGTKGVNYATNVIMQTAIKGGGGIVNQLKRSYSVGEMDEAADLNRNVKSIHHASGDYTDYADPSVRTYDPDHKLYSETDGTYRPRGNSTSREVRSSKTRSADVSDAFILETDDEVVARRRSPRSQDPMRSQPMPPYQEQLPKKQSKRGRSESRQRPKSLINAAEVSRGVELARSQKMGSTLSLGSDMELSESSSVSSMQSSGSLQRKTRSSCARKTRVSTRSSKKNLPSVICTPEKFSPALHYEGRSTMEVASDSD